MNAKICNHNWVALENYYFTSWLLKKVKTQIIWKQYLSEVEVTWINLTLLYLSWFDLTWLDMPWLDWLSLTQLNLMWHDLTRIDFSWLYLTWHNKSWLDLTWLPLPKVNQATSDWSLGQQWLSCESKWPSKGYFYCIYYHDMILKPS